jgi:phage/plasmid-like protein (TIGR03299 family)
MAHNIARIEGTDQAWYADKPAWHGLGTVTPGARTAKQVIRAIPVFRKRVVTAPVYMKVGGRMVPIEDRVATHREGSTVALGIVSTEFGLIQDSDGLATMEAIVNAARRASFVTGGALGSRGERAFASIDLSRVIDLRVKRDPSRHETHIFGTWAHDGTAALRIGGWDRRVECDNMAKMATAYAEAEGILVTIRHAGDVAGNLEQAQRTLGLVEVAARKHVELMTQLIETPVKPAWLREFVEFVVPTPTDDELGKRAVSHREDARDLILGLYRNAPDLAKVPQSAYRAHQAVIDYADHHRPLRIGADTPTEVAADRRFRSITEGPAAELKDRSLAFIRTTLLASAN